MSDQDIWNEKSARERERAVDAIPFEPYGNGLGALLACTTSSASVALVGYGHTLCINNVGANWAYLAFGSSPQTATTAHFGVPPGVQMLITRSDDPTTVAGITAAGTTTIQICRGVGN